MKKLLIFLTLLVGCGTQTQCDGRTWVDEGLRPYFNEFYDQLAQRDLTAKWRLTAMKWVSDIPHDNDAPGTATVGVCYTGTNQMGIHFSLVAINEKTRRDILKSTVFHELGHCVLGLCHSRTDGDVMYPIVPEEITKENLDAMFNVYKTGANYPDCK